MYKTQERRVVPAGEHTNADLLREKTRKGTFYSEALMLQEMFSIANRTNYREFGNADQRDRYTPKEIADLKKGGNENFADKTYVKFW